MGAGQSAEVPGGGTEGFHVLRVHENSPGQRAGLEPFFDYIVAIGKHRLVRSFRSSHRHIFLLSCRTKTATR